MILLNIVVPRVNINAILRVVRPNALLYRGVHIRLLSIYQVYILDSELSFQVTNLIHQRHNSCVLLPYRIL